jgi:ABC-type methionine transport system permease subunit
VLATDVATAAMVWSNLGVVVYAMRSVAKAIWTVEKGSWETADALGKATRWAAGAEGFKEARSKGPGLKTLNGHVSSCI